MVATKPKASTLSDDLSATRSGEEPKDQIIIWVRDQIKERLPKDFPFKVGKHPDKEQVEIFVGPEPTYIYGHLAIAQMRVLEKLTEAEQEAFWKDYLKPFATGFMVED